MNSRYLKSVEFLIQSEKVIPFASQTFSKSKYQYPSGASPLFLTKGKGCEVWDIDGNRYIDFVSNLASITIGYSDRKQNRAVQKQLKKGIGLSLPSPLETQVAEKIVTLIPSVEMVRFGKNGSDATSAAIRLARAYTGRNHVLVCGYHGWQDWFIGSTSRGKGVPQAVKNLTHTFIYNDLKSLQHLFSEFSGDVAAVILEPMNIEWPKNDFLQKVISTCEKEGAVCVFDETITGFRFSKGGAQSLFNVRPHLSTFGKGIANGFPLSAIGGRREIMMEMEEIFFSGTFGGELASLAAANYVLDLHLDNEISPILERKGEEFDELVNQSIKDARMEEFVCTTGHNSWKFLHWRGNHTVESSVIRQLFMQEIFKRGLLTLSTHNINMSHKSRLLNIAADVYFDVFGRIRKSIDDENTLQLLEAPLLSPLFKVR